MRVNIYAEENTDRMEIVEKDADGHHFVGLRIYLGPPQMHRPGDDDSSAVTFWGKDWRSVQQIFTKAVGACQKGSK